MPNTHAIAAMTIAAVSIAPMGRVLSVVGPATIDSQIAAAINPSATPDRRAVIQWIRNMTIPILTVSSSYCAQQTKPARDISTPVPFLLH